MANNSGVRNNINIKQNEIFVAHSSECLLEDTELREESGRVRAVRVEVDNNLCPSYKSNVKKIKDVQLEGPDYMSLRPEQYYSTRLFATLGIPLSLRQFGYTFGRSPSDAERANVSQTIDMTPFALYTILTSAGVLQGFVLGPLLFAVLIDVILVQLEWVIFRLSIEVNARG
eukprot:gene10239-7178_t